jgi:hypothetical protein
VLAARQLLSRTRAALGDADEGIALMTDVVERRQRGLGPEHPFTVASRQLLEAYRSGGGGRSAHVDGRVRNCSIWAFPRNL